jgi:hypothetical protein
MPESNHGTSEILKHALKITDVYTKGIDDLGKAVGTALGVSVYITHNEPVGGTDDINATTSSDHVNPSVFEAANILLDSAEMLHNQIFKRKPSEAGDMLQLIANNNRLYLAVGEVFEALTMGRKMNEVDNAKGPELSQKLNEADELLEILGRNSFYDRS